MSNMVGEIDGATPLDPNEMDGLLFKHIQTRGQLNELEHANIQSGMKWLKCQNKADLLTEQFVCKLHKKLFGEVWSWAGSFRKTGKNIGCDAVYIGIELRKLLDDTRYWLDNDTFPAKELAARFHHRLVMIHPFPNGNGRHSRIMADAILTIVMRQNPIDWSGGKSLLAMPAQRKIYIEALRSADKGDFTLLLKYVDA